MVYPWKRGRTNANKLNKLELQFFLRQKTVCVDVMLHDFMPYEHRNLNVTVVIPIKACQEYQTGCAYCSAILELWCCIFAVRLIFSHWCSVVHLTVTVHSVLTRRLTHCEYTDETVAATYPETISSTVAPCVHSVIITGSCVLCAHLLYRVRLNWR